MNGNTMIFGQSAGMQSLMNRALRAANSHCSILITGETGAGKELLAREIWAKSPRADKPFVQVNCGAMTESILESELFGHEKGSFTGANARHPGIFEQAHTGTILLDEIGDISPLMQVKLLRVLQAEEVRRVGGRDPIKVDVRVIAATHRDIDHLIAEGLFREDLYYRLKVVSLHLPPLRERAEEIPKLIEHFIVEANKKHGRSVEKINDEAMAILSEYPWPGNIRELGNIIEGMVVLSTDRELTKADLPDDFIAPQAVPVTSLESPPIQLPEGGIAIGEVLEHVERTLIYQALERTGGNRKQAAALLKMNRTTLVERLRRWGIQRRGN